MNNPLGTDPTPSNGDPRITHARLLKSAIDERSLYHKLITLYSDSTLHLSSYSQRLFSRIPDPNVVSWTALISAFSHSAISLQHFVSMLRHPTLPNQRTLATLFKTCANFKFMSFGLSLHSLGVKLALCSEPFCASALINFYCKCGMPGEARKVFDDAPERDEVCYSAAVVGLAQNDRSIDALSIFAYMKSCDVRSTVYSLSGALRAAAQMAAWDQCRIIHGHAVVTGFDTNVVVLSALVDGYGKAGLVEDARQVFDENLASMTIVGWNSMMAGYAQQGDYNSVIVLFDSMKDRGLVPDGYSFLAVLSSLCNAGLAVETERWLRKMKQEYGLEPWLEHYTCLVQAMGRVGRLVDAEKIAVTMPFEPDAAVWRTLLSSCASHGAADMAWAMARRLWALDPHDDSAYVIAANVLSSVGRWDEVAQVRKMMKRRRVSKESGKSWIEVKGKVYVFLAGDHRHERKEEIYQKLRELMEGIEKLGYTPVWNDTLHGVQEREKRQGLWYHSEKLAVAFGILSGAAPQGKPLRVVKNLRICRDCHEAFKYMSRLLEREIIIRDVNRYHRFLGLSCSCGDIW